MKVTQALVMAMMAFQANAFLDSTNQEYTETTTSTGGGGGSTGPNTQTGGNGGAGPSSVSATQTLHPLLCQRTIFTHHFISSQQGGDAGDGGDSSAHAGSGATNTISANHQTTGGTAGSNTNSQTTSCYGSCVTYVQDTAQGANGGAATDTGGNINFQGGNTDASATGGQSNGGNGGNVSIFPLASFL